MRRRDLLGIFPAAFGGIAGCSGRASDRPGAIGDERTTVTTQSESPLAVTVDRLQPGVIELTTPDSIGVSDADGRQFLYLDLDARGPSPPSKRALSLRFDGQSYSPVETASRRLWRAYNDPDGNYTAERGAGWVVFDLPDRGDASDAALTWDGGAWRLPVDVRARLSEPPPSLSVAWQVPETITPGATPTIRFEVRNAGDRQTQFVAGLNRSGPSVAYAPIDSLRKQIPAGETVSWSVVDSHSVRSPGVDALGDGVADLRYTLDWTGGQRDGAVRIATGIRDR
jgi:hypothetical protein